VGALDHALNVQRVRLACGHRRIQPPSSEGSPVACTRTPSRPATCIAARTFPPDPEGHSAPRGRRAAPGARDVGARRIDDIVRPAAQRRGPGRTRHLPSI